VPIPILATKLRAPLNRPNLVLRPSLIEKLNEGLHRELTLISAPAGFGKTTLAGEWIGGCARPSAWLSLVPIEARSPVALGLGALRGHSLYRRGRALFREPP
jgi:ATP/maltotriose-dependent transcriptional regulator MalT